MHKKSLLSLILLSTFGLMSVSCSDSGGSSEFTEQSQGYSDVAEDTSQSDAEDIMDHVHEESGAAAEDVQLMGCTRATRTQENQVNLGLTKKEKFLIKCAAATKNSSWCTQLVRPNPSSYNTFACTYGSDQSHVLIHPDETTWKYPIEAVKIIKDLQAKGIKVSLIYNWWRPEPYNKNVGGAAGRHPYGTSVDVRFASNSVANVAFRELCKMRKAGRIRAIGHYGSSSLHIGVGDRLANTWGKSCN